MKLWPVLLALWLFGPWAVVFAPPSESTDMISWAYLRGNAGKYRITLWADGRSEIVLERFGPPVKVNPGWTVTPIKPPNKGSSVYRKVNPYSKAEVKKKFSDALAAGIEQLTEYTYSATILDFGSTAVTIGRNGKQREIVIPAFVQQQEGEKDSWGSENHRRYLAVEKILGDFDRDAFQR